MSEELARLVAAINDEPDTAHGDYTPAVNALVEIGLVALPAVLPLLEATDQITRLRAQRVFELATRNWIHARVPARPDTGRGDLDWLALWRNNGDYRWDANPAARARAASSWRAWLAQQLPDQGP